MDDYTEYYVANEDEIDVEPELDFDLDKWGHCLEGEPWNVEN